MDAGEWNNGSDEPSDLAPMQWETSPKGIQRRFSCILPTGPHRDHSRLLDLSNESLFLGLDLTGSTHCYSSICSLALSKSRTGLMHGCHLATTEAFDLVATAFHRRHVTFRHLQWLANSRRLTVDKIPAH